jgi:polyisoprenoid-binding protein YceI
MSTITPETVEALPAGSWTLDPVHSHVGFEIAYLGGTFRGTFANVEAALSGRELRGTARVENVRVQDENLAAHLLSPDFFDAERHPELAFTSSDLHLAGGRVRVEGTLTIKGVTRTVELEGTIAPPVVDPYGRERVGLELATTVDRTEFGIAWNVPLPSGEPALSDDVRISAQLFLVKEA